MDYHRPHRPLNLRNMLGGFPTVRHPVHPWRESKSFANVHHARS